MEIYRLIFTRTIKKFPAGYWQQTDSVQNASEIIRYLIEQVLKWDDQEIKDRLTTKVFAQQHLSGMLGACFQSNVYSAMASAYPGRFKEWDFHIDEWAEEKVRTAVRWLIEEKLQLTDEQLKRKLSKNFLIQNGMGRILSSNVVSNHSPIRAIQIAYPGKFKEFDFARIPNYYWTKENIINNIRWLIEEELQWTDDEIRQKLTHGVLKKYNLQRVVQSLLVKFRLYNLINLVYPGRFKESDFNRHRHWQSKDAVH